LRVFNVSAEGLYDSEKPQEEAFIGTQGIARDVTEWIELENQFQQAQKMQAIGTLAGGIAHDFNNLLMGIQGNVSIILLDMKPDHPFYGYLKNIELSIENGGELTKQLLGFAKGGKYEVKTVDLNELIKTHNRIFGRTKKEAKVRGVYEKDLWAVDVDKSQIQQVRMNLYVNAWQAMPNGGDLHIRTDNIILDENYTSPFNVEAGRYVKISVTDTGIGIDKEIQPRIFDPFFTTKDIGKGAGLGLASVYGIIKNHRGIINVYSEEDKGSTFNIYLPASDKAVAEEPKISETVLNGSGTILLVDDEDMILDIGAEMLEKMGYTALTARSGKKAIDVYKKNRERISLVVLDMIIPGMNGGETYDRLRKINPDIKVLLSSGYSIDGEATQILNRGCNGFIQKPFSIKQLSQKISEVLDT
jgi:signal transduction histidine kinase/CheY-like chemotaxis protein